MKSAQGHLYLARSMVAFIHVETHQGGNNELDKGNMSAGRTTDLGCDGTYTSWSAAERSDQADKITEEWDGFCNDE